MHHVHSNGIMMVGSDQNKTKSKTSGSGSASGNMKRSNSRSGRTSPGLNVKRFTIPKKQKELLNEVELDSSEYLREVLPIIQQGYRDSSSKNKFNYEKVQLVHNPELKKEFMEKKREMKDAGRNEKELMESYAFLCVNSEQKAKQLSQESLYAGSKERLKLHCLGSPTMGVHVCRYSDVLHRTGVPKEGILLLFKILKGKVKAVPLVYGAAEILEPTPNYDCHVAKNSGEELPSSASHRLFDSSELFIYDFDEDEVDFRKRPRNICPYAVVHFTYSDSGVASSGTSSSNFNRTPVASSNESTPTRNISIPDTVGIAVVAPCFPREDVVTQRPVSDADRPFVDKYREYSERSYRVWSGQLHNKNGNSCRVSLVSFGLSFLPCKMPETLHALKAVRIRELRLPTKVFTGTVPILSRVKEAQANGKYYWYAELHSLSLDDAVYSRFLNYLSEKDLVLKKDLGERVLLYILPTGKTTQNLGLTTSSHPKIMHCLVESYVPMISHLTDITVKQPRHQVKPDLENAPIHDIDKDHLKRLRFQSSLAKLFYEQNRVLKDMGVKGDAEDVPIPVTLPGQTSVEQSTVEQSAVDQSAVEQLAVEQSAVEQLAVEQPAVEQDEPFVAVSESPASPDAPVDKTLSAFVPESHQVKQQQSNQRTAFSSNPELSPVDKEHTEHPAARHDWNSHSHDWRHKHPHSVPSWEHSHLQSIQLKEQSRHWAETQSSHANQEPYQNPHKQSQPVGEASNHHVIQQSPLRSPPGSHPAEHHRLGHQPYEQQSGRTEHRKGYQPYERQSSKEWAPPNASPRGPESRTHQGVHHHQDRHQPEPPGNTQYKRQSSSEWTDQQPSAKQRPDHQGVHHFHDRRPPEPPGNTQYKRQSSSEWTDQQPSAKQRPNQDRKPVEAPKGDLPPQIKEVASKVHNMLTGGIDLGLGLQGPAGGANIQKEREETDDEKIARMRATLQALVEERERLAKSNTKNSANPPTAVPHKGDEVLSSPSTNSDTVSESKPPDKPKESIVEEPTKSLVVEKPKEMAVTAGNGNEADERVEGKEGVDKVKEKAMDKVEKAMDKVEDDREKDAVQMEKKEKIVEETESKKRKLEELEGPVTKKVKVDVPKLEAVKGKDPVPKDQAVVPKGVVQKGVAIDEDKTISKPISKTDDSRDQQAIGDTKQESVSVKESDQKQKVPLTKIQEDPKKTSTNEKKPTSTLEKKPTSTLEKKPKSDVEEKNRVSRRSESAEKSSKVYEEITSASQMREYLERRHSSSSSEKRGSKEHISSASEMRMFLENPDKVSSKPKRIKSASEMRQFLNKSFTKDKSSKVTGSAEQKDNRQYRELEGKSRDDLLKNHDNDLASSRLENFLSAHHQITWTLTQGVRVTVKREMAGARLDPPPPGSSRNEEEDFSSITAVCHGSYRSMNGTHPDISTKEGLAYQIRQVIHHSQPVKKVEPRKVKAIQRGAGDQRKLSSSRDSTESREPGGRVESPADIPDGKRRGNSKSTSKKQPKNAKITSQVKKKSVSKVEAPSLAAGSKDMPVKVPRKPIKLKIKKTEKSYTTTIPSSGGTVQKGKATTQAGQVINTSRDPSRKNKNKEKTMAATGKSSCPSALVKQQPEAQLQKQPSADVDRSAHLDQGISKVNGHSTMETAMSTRSAGQAGQNTINKEENVHQDSKKLTLPPVDVTGAVRDLVKCLSADEIRQLIRVYDEIFSRRPDTKENQMVPRDSKEDPDAFQLSIVDPQPSGETKQSGLQKEDQTGKEKEEMVVPSDKTVSKICSDNTEITQDGSLLSSKKGKDECLQDDVQQVGEDHPHQKKLDIEQFVPDTKQPVESLLPKQIIPFLQKVEIVQAVDDVKPLGEDHPQKSSIPSLDMEEREQPADSIKPTEDEDTLPYPLELNQEGASGTDQGSTTSSDTKVPVQNEACIDLYDSERWSELDEDVQTDASKESTFSGGAEQSWNRQRVDGGMTSLEAAEKPVRDDAGDTTVSVASDSSGVTSSDKTTRDEDLERSDLLSILSKELENKPPISKQTDVSKQTEIEQVEENRKASVFDRLSATQPKARNVVVDDKGSADYSGMSLESSEYPEKNEDKLKSNDNPQPSSSLPAFLEASQSTLPDDEIKSTKHEEKSTRVSVFDRLYSKKPDQEPQKKRVSVFDRLYVPKPDKPEATQTESSKSERVSAFDRLSTRKITKTSAPEKEREKKITPLGNSSSKVPKEKTVKAVLSSKVNKIDSGKATKSSSAIASKVLAVKPKKTDEVVQKERQTSSKNVSKDVLKSKKRELPREEVSANKKYKLTTKDQVDKKDKYIDQQKANVKSDKEDKLRRKDPVKREEKCRDPLRENVSSCKQKQVTKGHGKKEEKVRDLQRERHTASQKPKEVTKDQSRREEKYLDKRSEKRLDQRSDRRPDQRDVSRKQDVKKSKEYKRPDSRGQDSDRSSVSTIEDSDSIRQNILKRANNTTSDFSKYVVSGRYLKLEGKKSPSPRLDPDTCEATSTDSTIKAEHNEGQSVIKDRIAVGDYSLEEQSKYDSKATTSAIPNNRETQSVSVQESYAVLDTVSRESNYPHVNETQIHTISVIGGSTSNSMRPFSERFVGNAAIANGLPDDLPLDKVSAIGNRGDNVYSEQIQNKALGEPYDSESPECPTTSFSPETQRAFEQALKASIGSPTKQDYRPESPTDSIRSVQSCHQDQPFITSTIPAPASSYNKCTFTQSTLDRDEPSREPADSRKIKPSLKAPSSRLVHFGNRFHPYDKRVKAFQGHCHSLREPATAELISNFCKEEFRLRKVKSASRLSALSQEEAFFDQARQSPSRFGSLNEKSHDEGTIQRAEEVEMTHSREGAGDAVTSQRGAQLEILDRQIEALTASGSDIQDYFILDANVYPVKNGDDSAMSGVPQRMRARRGRGRPPPPRHREPPHPYQIRAHFQSHPSASRGHPHGHPHGHWNEPSHRVWNGPSQRSFERWDRSPRYPSPNKYHYRKGH